MKKTHQYHVDQQFTIEISLDETHILPTQKTQDIFSTGAQCSMHDILQTQVYNKSNTVLNSKSSFNSTPLIKWSNQSGGFVICIKFCTYVLPLCLRKPKSKAKHSNGHWPWSSVNPRALWMGICTSEQIGKMLIFKYLSQRQFRIR